MLTKWYDSYECKMQPNVPKKVLEKYFPTFFMDSTHAGVCTLYRKSHAIKLNCRKYSSCVHCPRNIGNISKEDTTHNKTDTRQGVAWRSNLFSFSKLRPSAQDFVIFKCMACQAMLSAHSVLLLGIRISLFTLHLRSQCDSLLEI